MLKTRNVGVAMVLALMLSLALFTSGAFAQSVNQSNKSAVASTAVATHTSQGTHQALSVQPLSDRQVSQPQGWCGWWGCHRNFFHCGWWGCHRNFFHSCGWWGCNRWWNGGWWNGGWGGW
ncbi:MAG TPA: hypothetical protein VFV38_49120 [Ktedonobacteraceae bacterium]|nr:hypothetical protein [Ktedonobacteraceae bacterium]